MYVKGIRDLRGHIYAENYSPEIAAIRAVKAMYAAMCLLTGNEYHRISDEKEFSDKKITHSALFSYPYKPVVSIFFTSFWMPPLSPAQDNRLSLPESKAGNHI